MESIRVDRLYEQLAHAQAKYHVVRCRLCRAIAVGVQQFPHGVNAKHDASATGHIVETIRCENPESITFAHIDRLGGVKVAQEVDQCWNASIFYLYICNTQYILV